ncbi:MAG: major capsid protein [Armatimonadetes bacterium]|nr:major capsid protein [Armatimonadota bacterium]
MSNYTYPSNAELTLIMQEKLPVRTMDDSVFNIMPLEDDDAALVLWEQEDNYTGLMNLRGLEGQPGRVSRVGMKQYMMQPGTYGDFISLDETEITISRAPGSVALPINLEQTILKRQDQLMNRAIDRLRYIGWSLVSNGQFTVPTPSGDLTHSDSFNLQTYVAGTPWSTSATATPLADFRNVKLLGRGKGVNFGQVATAYMNQVTFNNMVSNTNTADLAGRRVAELFAPLNLDEINRVLLGEQLPQIEIYDDGYLDDSGTFQSFIPDNRVIVVGKRPGGQKVASFKMTRNANNVDSGPGMYTKVIDKGELQVPRTIEVHVGFNGGPVVYYPSAIVRMSV